MKFNTLAVREVIDALMPLVPGLQEQFVRLGNRSKHGITVELKPIRMKHSSNQRNYYWMSLHSLGKHLGYEAHEVEPHLHPVICSAAWGVKGHHTIRFGRQQYSWPIPNERSSKTPDGSDRDMESYSELIEALIRFSAEYGFVIHPPEQAA